jgi:hypothetical protein
MVAQVLQAIHESLSTLTMANQILADIVAYGLSRAMNTTNTIEPNLHTPLLFSLYTAHKHYVVFVLFFFVK